MSIHKPRTSIRDVPVANEKLYEEVARLTKVPEAEVRKMVEFYGKFIADTMKRGDMQGVMIPYFGKFRPKVKKLRNMKKAQALKASGMNVVYRAIKGEIVAIPRSYAPPEKATEEEDTKPIIP
jgi:nucleoid DNA-binding protein